MESEDPNRRERKKLQELLDSTGSLLESDLAKFMDGYTLDQITRMHDVVEAWLQGNSRLSHDQMIAEVAMLTGRLSVAGLALLSDESGTHH